MSNTLGKRLICLGDLPVPHPQEIRKSPCRAHHQVFTDTTKFSWSSPVVSVQARLTCQGLANYIDKLRCLALRGTIEALEYGSSERAARRVT